MRFVLARVGPACRTLGDRLSLLFMQAGWAKAMLWTGIDLVLPPRCPACGEIVEADGGFCSACWSTLRFITAPICAGCGEPFEVPQAETARCGGCLAAPRRFSAARAVLAYEGAARDVVLALKHADRPHLARTMAGQMARVADDWLTRDNGAIVPVPLHRWRLWRRGYNQAALLARALSGRSMAPLLVDALERVKATSPSMGMSRTQRARNVRGAIRLAPRARAQISARHIILVDDVFTTGATAEACARVLMRAGAARVDVLTWARVVRTDMTRHI